MDRHPPRCQARLPLSPLLFIIAYDPLLHFLSRMHDLRPFAYADDLAIFCNSVATISPALILISKFSLVSGLGVNKVKSAAIPTAEPSSWPAIRAGLATSPWKDLPLKETGTQPLVRFGVAPLTKLWLGSPLVGPLFALSLSHFASSSSTSLLFPSSPTSLCFLFSPLLFGTK